MVKFVAEAKSGPFIGLGITEKNVQLLKEGKPIFIDRFQLGINHNIGIFYAKNEKKLYEICKPFLNDNTEMREF